MRFCLFLGLLIAHYAPIDKENMESGRKRLEKELKQLDKQIKSQKKNTEDDGDGKYVYYDGVLES